jgi:formylmethanofuran dehydrogenase subunit C
MTLPLHFRWKRDEPPVGTMDASPLLPERWAGASVRDLVANKINVGNKEYRWDDVFQISGENNQVWSLPGNQNYLYLGRAMKSGGIAIDGHAGDYAGLQMSGGTMMIDGSAGHRLGAGMRGGFIQVTGNVGSELAGPSPDAFEGMSEGEIHVQGSAGPRVGFHCRRGLIAVNQAIEEAAYDMQAGTLVIVQGPWHHAGMNMKRGTVICLDTQAEPGWLPYFQPDAVFEPVIVRMILKQLGKRGYDIPVDASARYQHYSGDRLCGNKAEILQRMV